MTDYEPADKKAENAVQRYTHRAKYDQEAIFNILDEGTCAHVTFSVPQDGDMANEDYPVVIPMAYGRIDDTIYLHGYVQSRLLKALSEEGVKCCITVTTVQGYIIALAPYHNDCNFKSAIIFGHAQLCKDDEKWKGLEAITNEIWRRVGYNRWEDCRQPDEAELKATRVIKVPIDMASAKIGDSGVEDDKKDVDTVGDKYWTGVVKRTEAWTHAMPSSFNTLPEPDYVKKLIAIGS